MIKTTLRDLQIGDVISFEPSCKELAIVLLIAKNVDYTVISLKYSNDGEKVTIADYDLTHDVYLFPEYDSSSKKFKLLYGKFL